MSRTNTMLVHEIEFSSTPVHRIVTKLAEIRDHDQAGHTCRNIDHPSPLRYVIYGLELYLTLHFVGESAVEALVVADGKLVFAHFFQSACEGGRAYPTYETKYTPGDWVDALDTIITGYGRPRRLLPPVVKVAGAVCAGAWRMLRSRRVA